MRINHNISLLPFNTFRVMAHAKYFCTIERVDELTELIKKNLYIKEKHVILGEGSNVLFGGDFDGLVIKNAIHGIAPERETKDHVWVKACAGEKWDNVVTHAIINNWGGIENLSAIPGTVGAAPVQNIGAYGTEIKEVIESVEAIELSSGKVQNFSKEDCKLQYRDSVFKNALKGKYFIISVTLRLTKRNHTINLKYSEVNDWLNNVSPETITLPLVSHAIKQIRKQKLPDPAIIGNAGSFFKNPVISVRQCELLQRLNSDTPYYPIDSQHAKIPAGWLIEQCGWKGKRLGAVGVHPKQALVLVNYGRGSGKEIIALAKQVQESVFKTFNILLSPEVTILA